MDAHPHPLAQRLADGRILVRQYAREHNGTVTDGLAILDPTDPAHPRWEAELARWERDHPTPHDISGYVPTDYKELSFLPDSDAGPSAWALRGAQAVPGDGDELSEQSAPDTSQTRDTSTATLRQPTGKSSHIWELAVRGCDLESLFAFSPHRRATRPAAWTTAHRIPLRE